jgi:hypothetical protein
LNHENEASGCSDPASRKLYEAPVPRAVFLFGFDGNRLAAGDNVGFDTQNVPIVFFVLGRVYSYPEG